VVLALAMAVVLLLFFLLSGDSDNSTVSWTGKNGVVEIFDGDKLGRRYLGIESLATVKHVQDGLETTVQRGQGYLDANLNFRVDPDEKKVYFEISEFTNYIFFEQPDITDQ